MRPYLERLNGTISYRTFDNNVDEHELVWHRDKEDRLVKCTHSTDWKVQVENELPITLQEIFIPKETYHRLIKGTGNLHIIVEKF